MPPVWFDVAYRLTAADYKDIFVTKVLPLMRKITKNINYVFLQDGMPARIAKVIQEWLKTNMNFLSKDFWPP